MQYEYIKDATRAAEVAALLHEQPFFAYDTETTGLDQHSDKVVLMSFTDPNKNTYLVNTLDPKMKMPFKGPLESEKVAKVGFNLNFDYRLTKGTSGITMENNVDLMLGEYCMTQGLQMAGRDLETVTKKYLGKERDKSLQKSFIGHTGEFSEAQLAYAAEDTADLIPLGMAITKKIGEYGKLREIWNIENKVLPAFADITYYGQKIDRDKWTDIIRANEAGMAEARKEMDEVFKYVVDVGLYGELDINYDSNDQLLLALQRLGLMVDGEFIQNTDKKTQKKTQNHPAIKALTKYRGYQKAISTYGYSYLNEIHPKTGRIHPKMNQYGAESGRPTCNKPNILNIPRDVRYRVAFVTDEGRLIATVDYSGAELRILAERSGDIVMVSGFNSGVDFHCYVASKLFAKEVTKKNENAHLRQPTKELNFGIAYGMTAYSLYEKLNGGGYAITLEETRKLFNSYCHEFRTALGWIRNNGRIASEQFFLQTATGRMRYWKRPNVHAIRADLEKKLGKANVREDDVQEKYRSQIAAITREAGNFPIQSLNADFTKIAMYQIRKKCKEHGYDARMYNSVYDEIVLDIAEKDAEAVYDLQCKEMKAAAEIFLKNVPMDVEGHLAACWTK